MALECVGVDAGYGPRRVLRALTLSVRADEVVALLGPSGSGKSTLLSTVAGFVQPTAGEVRLGGRVIASPRRSAPPEARDVALVFQNYALWPHLRALDAVAYPLRRRGVPAREARRQARELLERLGLGSLADRRPAELSGGQQQRVGLARALARGASLYLFDEPTAHLDAPLRVALARELAERRKATGAGALYTTHDAGEALAVADRVGLLHEGELVQVGTARQVYEQPVDLRTARLTGPASLLRGRVERVEGDKVVLELAGRTVRLPGGEASQGLRGEVGVLVRPDWAGLGGGFEALVTNVSYRGPHTDYGLDTPSGPVELREPGSPRVRVGERATWSLDRVWLLPPPPA
jgi:ABC-type Fe3+/spermidine/putrescine transport system ATPase subunit